MRKQKALYFCTMIKNGDKVKLIDDVGEFTVQSIQGKSAVVIDEHGFEDVLPINQLMPVRPFNVSEATPKKQDVSHAPIKSKPARKKQKRKLEIDLHAGVLLGSTSGLTNHQIVLLQLDEAEKGIRQARKDGYTHVVLIHGKGKGKLRADLHQRLNKIERIEFYDAEYRLYSSGATEIKFY